MTASNQATHLVNDCILIRSSIGPLHTPCIWQDGGTFRIGHHFWTPYFAVVLCPFVKIHLSHFSIVLRVAYRWYHPLVASITL